MSGQVQITLRPPPNVEFVHGYPGIPPGGPDRVQAAVRGAVEIRAAPQGAKAKWVRIELRKVETLPGGGAGNTFYDFVGPSPINLWTASEEYGMLRTQDFPFSIRIPESIPPSIALDNRAGIHYELVASVCTFEKKGFLRRKKSRVQTQLAAIIIDKHELHSAWPVYCQHETRQQIHDGLTLTADRDHTCYGPGDPISVTATLKSDKFSALVCRGFELTLNETTIFRGQLTGKKSAVPVVKTVQVCEYKHLVNANLYGGTQQKAELVCQLSPDHTTTTLNAARHIDITYMLTVKAIVSPGEPVTIDLPVIVTNWQRNVSLEAIRRIGPAPTLSLLPLNVSLGHQPMRVEPTPRSSTLPIQRPPAPINTTPSSTLPPGRAEDVGYGAGLGFGARPTHKPTNSNSSMDEFGARPSVPVAGGTGTGTGPASPSVASATGRRPNSSRFTVANLPGGPPQSQSQSQSQARSGANKLWPRAEDEKERLYESARAKVEKVQGTVARSITPPPKTQTQTQTPTQTQAPTKAANPPRNSPWLTAEQEKLRLFNEAQAAVAKTQGLESYSPNSSLLGRSTSDVGRTPEVSRNSSATASGSKGAPVPAPAPAPAPALAPAPAPAPILNRNQSQTKVLSPADLYAQAISARNESLSKQQSLPAPNSPTRVAVPQYLTAEQEKAALRRYEQAKMAVDRVQGYGGEPGDGGGGSGGGGSGSGTVSMDPPKASHSHKDSDDLPPPFEMSTNMNVNANVIPASHIGEKERLRREYDRQDAARNRLQRQDTLPPSFLESQSHSQSTSGSQGSPPLHSGSTRSPSSAHTITSSPSVKRPTPVPPSATSSSRILTAAEEKAMLKSRYANEGTNGTGDVSPPYVNGNGHSHHVSPSPPPRPLTSQSQAHSQLSHSGSYSPTPEPPPSSPPPLMPRPPVEYIQETQEEDARVSLFAINGVLPPDEVIARSASLSIKSTLGTKTTKTNPAFVPTLTPEPASPSPPLEVRPFSPFSAAFEQTPGLTLPGPPPPLPPQLDED